MNREMKAGVCVRVARSREARRMATLHELEPRQDTLPATIFVGKFERFSVRHKRSNDAPFGSCAAALRDDVAIRQRLILAAGELDNDVLRRPLKRCITD